jgi:hypothetical protein
MDAFMKRLEIGYKDKYTTAAAATDYPSDDVVEPISTDHIKDQTK